jgi:periplasmic protein TonB
MYYLETGQDSRFRNSVLMALVFHAAVILSVSFDASEAKYKAPQIEVTLTTQPSADTPDDADRIAAHNQVGSGSQDDYTEITTRDNLPLAAAVEKQTVLPERAERETNNRDAVTTAAINRRMISSSDADKDKKEVDLDGISPELAKLNAELASLQAELDKQTRDYSEKPRVRRLTATSAKQSADAAYLLDWRRRLEAVGTKYYPEASVRYGIYGNVRMLVIIQSDGTLEDVKILSSSGYAVLDEAAIKIVQMAAPYSPFPDELKATTDKLEIVRTWQFQEN